MHGTKPKVGNRVTSGRSLFPKIDGHLVDGRTSYARRVKDLVSSYTSDAGGNDSIAEGLRSLIRRISCLQAQMEIMEAQWVVDGEASHAALDQYQRLANTSRRLIESAGLKTRAMKSVPDLQQYLAAKQRDRDRVTIEDGD
jgi:hypothetical protein